MLASSHKRELAEQINGLDKNEQEDIFLILKSHDVFFSRNTNGIFINMKNLNPTIMKEIELYINSLGERKQRMATAYSVENEAAPSFEEIQENDSSQPYTFEIVKLSNDEELLVAQFVKNIGVDKMVSKKSTHQSKFQTAKKKYSRPCTRADDSPSMGLLKQEYIM